MTYGVTADKNNKIWRETKNKTEEFEFQSYIKDDVETARPKGFN